MSFLYICHGFGAWVIRNGLARIDNLDLSFATLGVIFLDKPNEESGALGPSLTSKFRKLDRDFSLPDKVMADLKIRLREVKRDWDTIGTPQYGRWVKPYKVWTIEYNMNVALVRFTLVYIFHFPNSCTVEK